MKLQVLLLAQSQNYLKNQWPICQRPKSRVKSAFAESQDQLKREAR
jgi:hypothetical protein